MILLTTRKSRFFVVLLHLLGVSRHLPSSYFNGWNNGIIGVNPVSVVLESIDPTTLLHDVESRILLERQPHWLQDTSSGDQKCLDPMGGFSECGDATSWIVVPKYSSKRQAKWRQWITWATEEEETEENTSASRIEGYALQLIDDHTIFLTTEHMKKNKQDDEQSVHTTGLSRPGSSRRTSSEEHQSPSRIGITSKECLTRRRRDNELVLVPCSQERAWGWQFNEDGILHFKKSKGAPPKITSSAKRLSQKSPSNNLECLGRNSTHAILIPCDGRRPVGGSRARPDQVVQIAIVRQVSTLFSTSIANAQSNDHTTNLSSTTSAVKANRAVGIEGGPGSKLSFQMARDSQAWRNEHDGLPPSRNDIAHTHAFVSQGDETVESTPRAGFRLSTVASISRNAPLSPLQLIPHGERSSAKHNSVHRQNTKDTSNTRNPSEPLPTSSPSTSSIKSTVRKIQVNPYIAAAENEEYKDAQTGLVFRTDICKYLGHERKDVGRHTLVGVGYYTKTVFNIKVYGVALYVSKRDVLADPVMEEFASLSAEQLRERPDFYEALRLMKGFSTGGKTGTFDRTVFLKTNMQLTTEAMRSSLDADWKFLTPEAKGLLIGSSMKPRPASQTMLDIITSPDNPSRCSCAQIAPEEYNADPDCCARGTELVFTWRKDGNLEARLNGDFMDTFVRPDIAEAIFFEYLRLDDPMSTDFVEHAVDGFPNMMGPLAQVKGVSSPAMTQAVGPNASSKSSNPLSKAVEGVGGFLSSGANNVAGLVQSGASEIGSGAMNAARSVGDAAKNLGGEIDRRRERIAKHVSHFAHQAMTSVYSGKESRAVSTIPKWLATMPNGYVPENELSTGQTSSKSAWKQRILARVLGGDEGLATAAPDEISPMIQPPSTTTQGVFVWVVHLYLLLMLITSFPSDFSSQRKDSNLRKTSNSNRTHVDSDSDSESETGSSIGSDSERNASSAPFPGNIRTRR